MSVARFSLPMLAVSPPPSFRIKALDPQNLSGAVDSAYFQPADCRIGHHRNARSAFVLQSSGPARSDRHTHVHQALLDGVAHDLRIVLEAHFLENPTAVRA